MTYSFTPTISVFPLTVLSIVSVQCYRVSDMAVASPGDATAACNNWGNNTHIWQKLNSMLRKKEKIIIALSISLACN